MVEALGFHDARTVAHEAGTPGAAVDTPLAHALGATLAEPLVAACALPPWSNSAMDGWAVRGPRPWRVVGDVRAGSALPRALEERACVHIATGAAVPEGTTAVLRDEDSTERDGHVDVAAHAQELVGADGSLPAGRDVRPAGEEARAGEVLAPSGSVVTPALLGVAAASGHDHLRVVEAPDADLLVLGDELLDHGLPRDHAVRDSLGPQIPAWLRAYGVETRSVTRVADTLDAHVDAIGRTDARIVVTTGGTAAGPVDHLHRAVEECGGGVVVDGVLVRPGRPMLLATLPGDRYLVGLPGNPQSAVVSLLTLGIPLVAACRAQPLRRPERRVLAVATAAPRGEHRLVAAREVATGPRREVAPVTYLGSAMLRGLLDADGLALVDPGGADAGAEVGWIPFPAFPAAV